MLSILLVDDDVDEYDLFITALNKINQDYSLVHITGCENLLMKITQNKPDLVFLDINMPAVSGIQCLKNIRAEKRFQLLPIIMYSTSSNRKNIEQAYENKANFYVVKPYSIEGIISALEKIVTIDWQIQQSTSLNNFVIA